MDEREFLNMMEEILNVETELKMDTALEDIEEWDSLAYIMFQSCAARKRHNIIDTLDLKKAKTISDLYDLVK